MDNQRLRQRLGMLAPVLTAAVFTIEGAVRPGYHALTMYVSELSLGPRGWIQIANFIGYGGLLAWFALDVRRDFKRRHLPLGAPSLMGSLAAAIFLCGLFAVDSRGTLAGEHTVHGVVHRILSAYVLFGWPACLFLFAKAFRRDSRWRSFASWTIAAGVGTSLAFGILAIASVGFASTLQIPVGLIQRMHIFMWLGWQLEVARRLSDGEGALRAD